MMLTMREKICLIMGMKEILRARGSGQQGLYDHDEDAGVDDAQTAQPDLLLQIVVISEAVEVEVVPEAVVVVPTGDAIIKPLLICGKMTTQAFLMRISCQIKHLDHTTFLIM